MSRDEMLTKLINMIDSYRNLLKTETDLDSYNSINNSLFELVSFKEYIEDRLV